MDAKRYDKGKNRLELIPPSLLENVGKILTFGAEKYEDNNWMKGMKWSRCMGSLKRHLLAFEKGIDIDEESGELHIAHVIVNAMFLLEYSKTHPECDDRLHRIQIKHKITLDLDDVCVNFVEGWAKTFKVPIPHSWQFDRELVKKLKFMESKGSLEDFYMNLEPKIDPKELHFEPFGYVTARPVKSELSEKWLDKYGFPAAPVHTVGINQSKLEVIKSLGSTIHVDDNYDTYLELNRNGICCYLLDTLHNRKFNVGDRRIKSLKDLPI